MNKNPYTILFFSICTRSSASYAQSFWIFFLFYIYIYYFYSFYLSKNRTNSIFNAILLLLKTNLIDRYSRKIHHMHFSLFFIIVYFIYRKFIYELNFCLFYLWKIHMNSIFGAIFLLLQIDFISRYY